MPDAEGLHEGDCPVTVVIVRTPRRGQADAYEDFLSEVVRSAHTFPGHLGVNVMRPSGSQRAFTLIFRFDCVANLVRWERSDARRVWAARASVLCEGDVEEKQAIGVDAWFSLADRSASARSRMKMALLAWVAAFPTIAVLNQILIPHLMALPPIARSALIVTLMIALMTFVWMPLLTRCFTRWLDRR